MKLFLDFILALLLYIKLEEFTIIGILDSLVKDKKDWYLDEMLQKAAKERNGFIAADIIEGFLHKCYLK
ncbi:unnamed protein product [Rhizophagus irregularis]|nr:unnamed protein product [Rhizophagus irregularis]